MYQGFLDNGWAGLSIIKKNAIFKMDLGFSGMLDPGSLILDPGSWTLDPGSWILDPGSRILDPPAFWILDPGSGSRTLDPNSRIRIHDPGFWMAFNRLSVSPCEPPQWKLFI